MQNPDEEVDDFGGGKTFSPAEFRVGRPKRLTESARKRKQSARDKKRIRSVVNLGVAAQRWNELRAELRLRHSDVATLLLNSYHELQELKANVPADVVAGTSGDTHVQPENKQLDLSAFSLSDAGTDQLDMQLDLANTELQLSFCESQGHGNGVTGEEDDPDFDPSQIFHTHYDSQLIPDGVDADDADQLGLEALEDLDSDYVDEDDDENDDGNGRKTTSRTKSYVKQVLSGQEMSTERCSIIYEQQLHDLLNLQQPKKCCVKKCNARVTAFLCKIGTAFKYRWKCENGHLVAVWSSQPMIKHHNAGDFLIAASVIPAGQNFSKVKRLLNALHLGCPAASTFYQIQKHVVVDTVEAHWKEMQDAILQNLSGKELILSGDCRNDSPGHSSQYGTYVFMDYETNTVVHVVNADKREVKLKSPNLETYAFRKGMKFLLDEGMNITEFVSDQHIAISAIMKNEFHKVNHQYDVWHCSKGIAKRLTKAGQEKGCGELLHWVGSIIRHFWWACREAQGSEHELEKKWLRVMNHVVNNHKWIGDGCDHLSLEGNERDKPWLESGSPAHQKVIREVENKKLTKILKYLVNFRHTSQIETFNDLILVYAAKRFAFRWEGYIIRVMMAAIDHNYHKDRAVVKKQNGDVVVDRRYSKRTKRWTVCARRKPKSYGYLDALLSRMIDNRLAIQRIDKGKEMRTDDPKRIAKTTAAYSPPTTEELRRQHESRLGHSL